MFDRQLISSVSAKSVRLSVLLLVAAGIFEGLTEADSSNIYNFQWLLNQAENAGWSQKGLILCELSSNEGRPLVNLKRRKSFAGKMQ